MSRALDQNLSGIILFVGFFILYGLEIIIPLVRRKSRHFLSNVSFAVVLTAINLLFTSLTFFVADFVAGHGIGLFNSIGVNNWLKAGLSIIFLDLWAGYFVHFLFHKFGWLWKLHSIHHSDDLVDVTTTFRQHPAETLIRILFNLSGLVILGIPVWILFIYLTLSTIQAQIEHANISIPARLDKILQYILVTPNMHKIHHSRDQHETDSNYSNIFSFWDKIFHTYQRRNNYGSIRYGLDYLDSSKHYSFWELLKLPFKNFH